MINITPKDSLEQIVGNGPSLPISFSQVKNTQLLKLSTGVQRINEAIHMLLNTSIGERWNNPEYGCYLRKLLFEPNDLITQDLLYYSISTAISRWEKRISVTNISFSVPEENEHEIIVAITYIINSTHVQGTYVFPYTTGPMPFSELITGKQSIGITSLL